MWTSANYRTKPIFIDAAARMLIVRRARGRIILKNKRIRPTIDQFNALALLRARIGELGYLIVPVAPKYRRHKTDFVAIPKDDPHFFAIVRAAAKRIVIRPFGGTRGELHNMIPYVRKSAKVPIYRAFPRPMDPKNDTPWRDYSDPSAHDELVVLGTSRELGHA